MHVCACTHAKNIYTYLYADILVHLSTYIHIYMQICFILLCMSGYTHAYIHTYVAAVQKTRTPQLALQTSVGTDKAWQSLMLGTPIFSYGEHFPDDHPSKQIL